MHQIQRDKVREPTTNALKNLISMSPAGSLVAIANNSLPITV